MGEWAVALGPFERSGVWLTDPRGLRSSTATARHLGSVQRLRAVRPQQHLDSVRS
jgi:hypothetical protein